MKVFEATYESKDGETYVLYGPFRNLTEARQAASFPYGDKVVRVKEWKQEATRNG